MGFNNALAQLPEDDFQFAIKNGARKSALLGFDFVSLIYNSFGFVKDRLPELVKSGDFEKMVLECFWDRGVYQFTCDIDRIPSNDMLHFLCWIKDELEMIGRLEQEYLSGDPDIDLVSAGVHELNQFGDLNTIDALAGGDVLKWDEIKKLPYCKLFDKQFKSAIEAKIQKKLIKIKSKPKK